VTLARLPLLVAPALFALTACAADSDWETFKQGFVQPEGRVIDTGQGRITHSEGQGFAMLFAVHYDDTATFDLLWQWTQKRLQVRDDALMAWRWDPQQGNSDKNNASDGDVLIAWALIRGAERWQRPDYAAAGQRIARDIRKKLLKRVAHGLVLLPGVEGFDKPEGMTINLSYWVFPALRELARADPAPEWADLEKTGLEILGYSRFGRWGLPPDWLKLGERVAPADGFPERFGFDAVRIPLYLLWSRKETEPLLRPYREFWGYFEGARFLPAWTNLKDDGVDSFGADMGIRAIAQVIAQYPQAKASRLPALEKGQAYYSSALLLLCKIALRERGDS
jgi:endoglucanase